MSNRYMFDNINTDEIERIVTGTDARTEYIQSIYLSPEIKQNEENLKMNGDTLKAIASNGAVWGALLLLVNLIVQTYFPQIPENIIAAAQVLAIAILGAAGVYVAGKQNGYVEAMRERGE